MDTLDVRGLSCPLPVMRTKKCWIPEFGSCRL